MMRKIEQLELNFTHIPPPVPLRKEPSQLYSILAGQQNWMLCREIIAYNPRWDDRKVRGLAFASQGLISSGQRGYRLTSRLLPEEFEMVQAQWKRQTRDMGIRLTLSERCFAATHHGYTRKGIKLDFIQPTLYLEKIPDPFVPTDLEIARFVAFLKGRPWTQAFELEELYAFTVDERTFRSWASRSNGHVASGNRGYRLTAELTPEEFKSFFRRLHNQIMQMIIRLKQIRFCRALGPE